MSRRPRAWALLVPIATAATALPVAAQEATFVHRLGSDTMAVERYARTSNRVAGEVASRLGANVTRLQYDVALGQDGRALSATFRSRSTAGAPLPNQPTEIRLTFTADSVRREAVFSDSTNVRTLPAARGIPVSYPAFGLYEIAFAQLRRGGAQSATFAPQCAPWCFTYHRAPRGAPHAVPRSR